MLRAICDIRCLRVLPVVLSGLPHDLTDMHNTVDVMAAMDVKLLDQYQKQGWLRSQRHPQLPLRIWNYTDAVQFARKWDGVTSVCRGLITHDDGHVVARSFKKFHNLEENLHSPTDDYVVFEKLDGSLIVVFFYEGQWRVASRGSFTSTQASTAAGMIRDMYDMHHLDKSLSYVFEIIYSENRIVIDYGSRRELVFLAAFDKSGREHWPAEEVAAAGFRLVQKVDMASDHSTLQALQALDWDNAEGFVVKFTNGERVKLKFSTYCKLHKMMSGLDAVSVWEWFRSGKDLPDIVHSENIPDELHGWLATTYNSICTSYNAYKEAAEETAASLSSLCRKDCAARLSGNKLAGLVFAVLDNKPIHDRLCKLVKPGRDGRVGYGAKLVAPVQPCRPPKLTLMVGVAGSGKTTKAMQHTKDRPHTVIVSRDTLRKTLFGDADLRAADPDAWKYEDTITAVEMAMVRAALEKGSDVVVDDTNLRMRTVNGFLKAFNDIHIDFDVMDTDTEVAIRRDSQRARPVGEKVIRTHAARLEALKNGFDLSPRPPPTRVEQDPSLPTAYVFDVDGTIAIHKDRHPMDWSRVQEDGVDHDVAATLRSLSGAGHKIVICTARDSCARQSTLEWLAENEIHHDDFFIRPPGDCRADFEVKEDFWRELCTRYRVVAMVDDRDQVVFRARKLGFKVFQVAPGNF